MFYLWSAPNHCCACVFCDRRREGYRGNGPLWGQFLVLIGYLWLWLASDWFTQVHCCDTAQKRRNSCVLDHNNDQDHFITMSSALVSRDIFVMRWWDESAIMQLNTQLISHDSYSLQTGRWGLGIRNCPCTIGCPSQLPSFLLAVGA